MQWPTNIDGVSSPGLFRTKEASLFHAYYGALQKQTSLMIPPRAALSPRDARAFLPYLCIQEVRSPEVVVLRLVGTVIVNRMGFDPSGRNMFEPMTVEQRSESWQHIQALLTKPCGSALLVNEPYENKTVPCEVVSFPFADQTGTPKYVVSLCVETDIRQLTLRGASTQRFGQVLSTRVLDIGAGV
jgi:hypothetical protein